MGDGLEVRRALLSPYLILLLLFSASGILIGDSYRAAWGLLAVILAAFPAILEGREGWALPWFVKFLIGLSLALHIGGGIFGWYSLYYPVYDKIAHLISSSTLALLVLLFLLLLTAFRLLPLGRMGILLTLVLVTCSLGVTWEYVEYLIDANFLSSYFLGLNDSLVDTPFNLLGAVLVAVLANGCLKTRSPGGLFAQLVRKRW